MQCLSRFQIAFKTSISNKGFMLYFTLQVLIGTTESTAENVNINVLVDIIHTEAWFDIQKILLILIYPKKVVHLSNFSLT